MLSNKKLTDKTLFSYLTRNNCQHWETFKNIKKYKHTESFLNEIQLCSFIVTYTMKIWNFCDHYFINYTQRSAPHEFYGFFAFKLILIFFCHKKIRGAGLKKIEIKYRVGTTEQIILTLLLNLNKKKKI